ncbi:hypothetical protein [Sphingobium chungbukense]|uniref:hypothetical protein n=1 Tax=Sphingobium chungbukense TaxID=56193 RepID=UPI0012ED48F7|nr:hypothetical protein [Sphingobium chungbukense]
MDASFTIVDLVQLDAECGSNGAAPCIADRPWQVRTLLVIANGLQNIFVPMVAACDQYLSKQAIYRHKIDGEKSLSLINRTWAQDAYISTFNAPGGVHLCF